MLRLDMNELKYAWDLAPTWSSLGLFPHLSNAWARPGDLLVSSHCVPTTCRQLQDIASEALGSQGI